MLPFLALNTLGLPAKQESVLLAPLDCGAGCTPGAAVHGDPMFKVCHSFAAPPVNPPTVCVVSLQQTPTAS